MWRGGLLRHTVVGGNEMKDKIKGGFGELWKNKLLYLMTLPAIIWVAIFCYYPMYGILIAFKKFSYKYVHDEVAAAYHHNNDRRDDGECHGCLVAHDGGCA